MSLHPETAQLLRSLGTLTPEVEEALETVPRPVHAILEPLQGLPVPVSTAWPPARDTMVPSPGVLSLMVRLVTPEPGATMHILGPAWMKEVVQAAGYRITARASVVLALNTPLQDALEHVAHGGVCVHLVLKGRGHLGVYARGVVASGVQPDAAQVRLLGLEAAQQGILLGRPSGWAASVWRSCRALYKGTATSTDRARGAAAFRSFTMGYAALMAGETGSAALVFQGSHAIQPSAEARTFEAWSRGMEGQLQLAIDICKEAIEIDPGFGNPYNDVGAYLLELGKEAEAVDWFHRALAAPRYETRWFPLVNLARAHLAMGRPDLANGFLEQAAHLAPDDPIVDDLRRQMGR